MKCPLCKETELVMAERQNIEIDYCPQCRGVWLDRGELDKLIERAAASVASDAAPARPAVQDAAYSGYPSGKRQDEYHRGYPQKKRKGFLSDLFDFD